jgi:hypothetical protein
MYGTDRAKMIKTIAAARMGSLDRENNFFVHYAIPRSAGSVSASSEASDPGTRYSDSRDLHFCSSNNSASHDGTTSPNALHYR